MKGLFIPEITAEMFRNGCLESIETLMAEGEIYDIDYQRPCEDAMSRILKRMWNCRGKHTTSIDKVKMEQILRDELPLVNPQYTEDEIQKMQYLEQAEIEKAYELGKAEGQESGDAISRQAVLEYIEGSEAELGHGSENELVCQYIKELPPVTLEQHPCGDCVSRHEVLDKIIDEISEYKSRKIFGVGVADLELGKETALDYVLAIIDQCRPESEE